MTYLIKSIGFISDIGKVH